MAGSPVAKSVRTCKLKKNKVDVRELEPFSQNKILPAEIIATEKIPMVKNVFSFPSEIRKCMMCFNKNILNP